MAVVSKDFVSGDHYDTLLTLLDEDLLNADEDFTAEIANVVTKIGDLPSTQFKCDVCEKMCKSQQGLSRHKNAKHISSHSHAHSSTEVKTQQADFMWKLEHNLIPNTIKTNFITNSSDIVTRLNLSKLRLPNVRLDMAKRSVTFAGVKLWNTEIPSNFKTILSLKTFTKKYRLYLISQLS